MNTSTMPTSSPTPALPDRVRGSRHPAGGVEPAPGTRDDAPSFEQVLARQMTPRSERRPEREPARRPGDDRIDDPIDDPIDDGGDRDDDRIDDRIDGGGDRGDLPHVRRDAAGSGVATPPLGVGAPLVVEAVLDPAGDATVDAATGPVTPVGAPAAPAPADTVHGSDSAAAPIVERSSGGEGADATSPAGAEREPGNGRLTTAPAGGPDPAADARAAADVADDADTDLGTRGTPGDAAGGHVDVDSTLAADLESGVAADLGSGVAPDSNVVEPEVDARGDELPETDGRPARADGTATVESVSAPVAGGPHGPADAAPAERGMSAAATAPAAPDGAASLPGGERANPEAIQRGADLLARAEVNRLASGGRIELDVGTAALGPIRLEAADARGIVQISLQAERPETRHLIGSHLADLHARLGSGAASDPGGARDGAHDGGSPSHHRPPTGAAIDSSAAADGDGGRAVAGRRAAAATPVDGRIDLLL